MNLTAPMLKVVSMPSHWRALLPALVRTVIILVVLTFSARITLTIFGEALVLIGR